MSDIIVTNNVTNVTVTETGVTIEVASGNAIGIPPGGTTGQVLAKSSGVDYATQWVDQTGGGGDVASVNNRTGAVTLGPNDLLNVTGSRLIGRQTGTPGPSQEISLGSGLKFSGTTLTVNYLEVAAAADEVKAGDGLIGGGEIKDSPTMSVAFASATETSATKSVPASDPRIVPWSNTTPTLATNLAGIPAGTVIPANETAVQILNRILYPYQSVSFSAFSVSGLESVYEIGQPFPFSSTATWVANGPTANWVVGSGAIAFTSPTGFTTSVASGFNLPTGIQSITYPSFTIPTLPRVQNSIQVTLSGSQQQGSVTPATVSRSWFSRMYFGKSTNANLLAPTFTTTGSGSGNLLQTTAAQGPTNYSASVAAGAGFFYLFIHDSYTLNNDPPFFGLKFGGNALATDPVIVVSLTNQYGITANYKRYKSTFELGGDVLIVVNPTS